MLEFTNSEGVGGVSIAVQNGWYLYVCYGYSIMRCFLVAAKKSFRMGIARILDII